MGEPDSRLAISVRGLLVWLAGLALAGYLAAATALLFWLDRSPHNRVAFADTVALPFRWRRFQALRGQSLIAEGRADMRAGHWADALFKLRSGLAREPGDLRARLILAQFYIASNQRPLARRTLGEGLTADFPGQEYLGAVVELAAQAEDYAFIDTVYARYLPKLEAPREARVKHWLPQQQLQNFIDGGQAERVLAAKETIGVVPASTRAELRVLALLALGRPDDAVRELHAWRARVPAETDQVLRLLARAEREAKRYEAMENALDEHVARAPGVAAPYVYRVVQLALAGRMGKAEAALADYLRRFDARLENLRLLAEPLATFKGTSPMLARMVTAAREQGFETRGLQLLRVQALLGEGAAREAGRVLAEIPAVDANVSGKPAQLTNPLGNSPRQLAAEQALRDWLQLVADALLAPTPAAQTALVDGLRNRPMTMATLRTLVTMLRAGDRAETALAVLRVSEGPYPGNPWAQAQMAELTENARRAAMVKDDVAVKASETTLGQKPFFAQLDESMRAKDWAAAQQQVRELRNRQPAPAWLAARDAELLLVQMRYERGAGERLAMLIAAKLYLDGDGRRSQAALALAQEFYADGAKEEALLLVKEILRKAPNFPPAERQLAAWTPQKK
ncbi:MAG: tetratricopeptide repeat protein [Undibacterium sp.]|nr:tetratricopeptide repeat protein [Opitutaceae bacterium]